MYSFSNQSIEISASGPDMDFPIGVPSVCVEILLSSPENTAKC